MGTLAPSRMALINTAVLLLVCTAGANTSVAALPLGSARPADNHLITVESARRAWVSDLSPMIGLLRMRSRSADRQARGGQH